MLRNFFLLIALSLPAGLRAQLPFTQKAYAWQVEKDLVYGTAVNYLGQTDTLTLDLYKPLNDDVARPLLVLVHGGAWLSGCKEDMAWLCEEMAARGYVVATVNYRKGWHKDDYVPAPINPDLFPNGNCLYAADSLEIIRAIYRGQQDVKAAVRWLKARVFADSTCNHAVLAGGESAGAFLALATGLLDRPEEKPAACFALPDAPAPGNNLSNCFSLNCAMQTLTLPPGARARPDLGPVDGETNLNGYDANVQGVISFFGGIPSTALSGNWIQGPDTPALYLYHQTCDGIVPFQYGKPFFTISAYCNLGFTPWHPNFPLVLGNGALANYLGALDNPPPYQTDFLSCPAFDPNLAFFECLRFNDNGSYHYPHNRPERAGRVAAFFSPLVTAKLNSPPCLVSSTEPDWAAGMRPSPNPFRNSLFLYCEKAPAGPVQVHFFNQQGELLTQNQADLRIGPNELLREVTWPPGLYYLRVSSKDETAVWKLVHF